MNKLFPPVPEGLTALEDLKKELGVTDETEFLTPELEKQVRWKLDLHLSPLFALLSFIQYFDKATINQGASLQMNTDTNLSTSQFSWLGTIFYLGYLIFEFPQNLALQRFPPARWMALNILFWGLLLLLSAFATNFDGLVTLRFFLGASEGSNTAGMLILTSTFYTAEEHAQRVGLWWSMVGLADIVAGLLGYGTNFINTPYFHPWKWFFIFSSFLTFINGYLYWFHVPDSPVNARFLSTKEKICALLRLRRNQGGMINKEWKQSQFIEALKDSKTWLFAFFAFNHSLHNSLTTYGTTLIKGFGYSSIDTTLLSIPNGVIEFFVLYTSMYVTGYYPNTRAYTAMFWVIPSIISTIFVITLPSSNKVGLLLSYYFSQCITPCLVICISWVNSCTAGHTKRVTTNTIFLIAYCLGNLISPQMFTGATSPRYIPAWIVIAVVYVLDFVVIFAIRIILAKENRRRHEAALTDSEQTGAIEVVEGEKVDENVALKGGADGLRDLTDRENLLFIYPL